MADERDEMGQEHADIAALFVLPPDFWMSQDWGEHADPQRVEEFVDAYERSTHASVWADSGLAELIWDSFARLWSEREGVCPSARISIERFIARWNRRLGVRRYLSMMATIEDRPGDPYPENEWLRSRWSPLTGEPLDTLVNFNFLAALDDRRTKRDVGPPALFDGPAKASPAAAP
jgi:hypothetical protein